MKKYLFILIIVLICLSNSFGEVNNFINIVQNEEDFTLKPVIGTFEFIENIEPLKEITINYTLTVAEHDRLILPEGEWEIQLIFDHKSIQLLSDSIIYWNGNHQPGDQVSGEIVFVIMTSGFKGFDIGLKNSINDTFMKIRWCMTEEGNLIYLGNSELLKENIYEWGYLNNTFFTKEQIHIIQTTSTVPSPHNSFRYDIVVEPAFQIGDTSNVTFNFVSTKHSLRGFDIFAMLQNFELISSSPTFQNPLKLGDTSSFIVRVVPLLVNDIHNITVFLEQVDEINPNRINSQKATCNAIFNDDGSLRYVSDHTFTFTKKDILPNFINNIHRVKTKIKLPFDSGSSIKKYEY